MAEMNKYAKEYMDNYLAKALAAKNNTQTTNATQDPSILARALQESLALSQMQAPQMQASFAPSQLQAPVMQEQAPQAYQMQASLASSFAPPRAQIVAPPQDATDFSDATGHFNNALEAGGENSPVGAKLLGVTQALDSHSKTKAEKEKKEYLVKALQSQDPYAIAQAGHPDLAKILLQQEENRAARQEDRAARQQERQENREFKISERNINREDALAKLLMEQSSTGGKNFADAVTDTSKLRKLVGFANKNTVGDALGRDAITFTKGAVPLGLEMSYGYNPSVRDTQRS